MSFELSKGIYCAIIALISESMYDYYPHIPNPTPASMQKRLSRTFMKNP
jgi:hypothetical protein